MERDFGEVLARHAENIVGIGQEHIASLAVNSHKLMFALFEGSKSFGIIAFNPAGFCERNRFPTALSAVFM